MAFGKDANCRYKLHGKRLNLYVEASDDVFVERKSHPRIPIRNLEHAVSFHFEEIVISLELFATINLQKAMSNLRWLSCDRVVYHGFSIVNFPDYEVLSEIFAQLKAKDVKFESTSSLGDWNSPGRLALFSYADIFGIHSFKFLSSFTMFSHILLDLATSVSMANDLLLPTLVQSWRDGLGQNLKCIRCYFNRNDEGDQNDGQLLREILSAFLVSVGAEDVNEKLTFDQGEGCLLRQRVSNSSGQHALMVFSKVDRTTKLFHLNRLRLDFIPKFDPGDQIDFSVFDVFEREE